MRLCIVKIGKISYQPLQALAHMYQERLGPLGRVTALEFKDDAAFLRAWQAREKRPYLVTLDERGRSLSSLAFAEKIQGWCDDPGVKELMLVVGGPMGLPAEVKSAANYCWSLSPATLTSDMAWLLCWEQVYRAFTIIKGTSYHHA